MAARFHRERKGVTPIVALSPEGLAPWLEKRSKAERAWVETTGFSASLGQTCLLPASDGSLKSVLFGWGSAGARARSRHHLGNLPGSLPKGDYRLTGEVDDPAAAALGWLLGSYRFRRYSHGDAPVELARLAAPKGTDARRLETIAQSAALTCDLINTPANDMGPRALERAFMALAAEFGARASVIRGSQLITENLPLIHAVGRAASQKPRLLDLTWGDPAAPKVTIVGKGVCFDTGGLNLKPGRSMGLMKKDMGGAANALGLARMIMALDLPIRLRLLVPAVENAVAGNAFRPGDILTSRKGLTVEINNTDAEGRLVLADAMALGAEEEPEFMVTLATLTGAARVALGPDIPPVYVDDEPWADAITSAAMAEADPLWRMPFWAPYEGDIEPGIADLDNAPAGGMAGSITAALFLKRFASGARAYAHLDIYGWTPSPKPGRPKGGACQGARALLAAIEGRFGTA